MKHGHIAYVMSVWACCKDLLEPIFGQKISHSSHLGGWGESEYNISQVYIPQIPKSFMSSQFTCSFVSIHDNGELGFIYIYIYFIFYFIFQNCDIGNLGKNFP